MARGLSPDCRHIPDGGGGSAGPLPGRRLRLLSLPKIDALCEFDGVVSDRIKTYLMRNARAASLHSSISMGKGPWRYNDELVSKILLECTNFHARQHPYIHSNAIKFYQDGYPPTRSRRQKDTITSFNEIGLLPG